MKRIQFSKFLDCGYCIEFAPTWNEVGKSFKDEDSVVITKMNVAIPEHITHPLISKYEIRGIVQVKMKGD